MIQVILGEKRDFSPKKLRVLKKHKLNKFLKKQANFSKSNQPISNKKLYFYLFFDFDNNKPFKCNDLWIFRRFFLIKKK